MDQEGVFTFGIMVKHIERAVFARLGRITELIQGSTVSIHHGTHDLFGRRIVGMDEDTQRIGKAVVHVIVNVVAVKLLETKLLKTANVLQKLVGIGLAYSWFFDKSQYLFEKKKEILTGLDLTIITPSNWMADQVKQSFLNIYDVKVIHNGINLSVFRPAESDFRKRYGLEDKFVILGVAFGWGERKGLDVFVELSRRLDDRFKIVLIGTNDDIDKQLPENIVSIHRTQNQAELAEIYTAADLLVNPTREENYPTVHMESLACGTPVLSFATGGCAEMLDDTCGMTVPKNDIDAMEKAIVRILEEKPFSAEACIQKATEFREDDRFKEYVKLYEADNSLFD